MPGKAVGSCVTIFKLIIIIIINKINYNHLHWVGSRTSWHTCIAAFQANGHLFE